MTALDRITRRQYLEEELALAAATHQYVYDGPTPTRPADRDVRNELLDRLRARWTRTRDCLRRHTDPAHGGDPEWRGPVKQRARHAAGGFATAPGAAETALKLAVERAQRALFDDDASYSVSQMHDTAMELINAARALLTELETR